MVKNYLKGYAYLFSILLILTVILSILNYFIKLPTNIIKIFILLISLLISSIIIGKNTKEKAYIEGIKYTSIYLALITIIKIILKSNFNYKTIIIYISLLLTGIIGATIGINNTDNDVSELAPIDIAAIGSIYAFFTSLLYALIK